MSFSTIAGILAAMATLCGAAGAANAQTDISDRYAFMEFQYPGSPLSTPLGINAKREVVGYYVDSKHVDHGYIWSNGVFNTIDYPGAQGTAAGGINDRGDIAGVYFDFKGYYHGYTLARPESCGPNPPISCLPVFTSIDVPGGVLNKTVSFEFGPGLGTAAIGINIHQQVVGMYCTPGLWSDAFVLTNGAYSSIDAPLASHATGDGTKSFSIADNGTIAADYLVGKGRKQVTHAILIENGAIIPIDVPNSTLGGFGTQVNGVNARNEAGGVYTDPTGRYHGFLWKNDRFFRIDYPDKPYSEVNGINNRGDITGDYGDAGGDVLIGYIAFRK